MEENKVKKFIIPKIINIVLLVLVSAWMFWGAIDSINQINSGNGWAGLGYAVVLILGGIGLAVCLLFSIICLAVACVFKAEGRAKANSVVSFVIFAIIPIIVFVTIILMAPN